MMTKPSPRKTMKDITSSLVGSSFRRVHQDGRVTFTRNITTLGQLLARNRADVPNAKVRRTDSE